VRNLLLAIVLVSVVPGGTALGQSRKGDESIDRLLSRLPSQLKLREDRPQKYRLTFDYLYMDALANLTHKERVVGEYTRALPDGKSRWASVSIARGKGFDDPYPEGTPQKYMEGFSYNLTTRENMLKPEFFPGFPENEIKTKNLVWDMHMIEQFSWDHFDKLELNRPYAIQAGPEDVPLAGAGTFQNRKIMLTWIGVSRRNGELCALIQYHAFANKFTTTMMNMTFQGRSHYWGEIWVSLVDKQIEHATLFEDVLVEFAMPGQPGKQLVGVLRQGTFEKILDEKSRR
jgi:hypothetical protein